MNFRRSVIIAELWRSEVARRWRKMRFWHFWKNDSLLENFQNSIPREFIATPVDLLCSNFVKFGRLEIRKVVRYLRDKKNKISPRSPVLATARIAPKICQGQPQTKYSKCSRFHPNRFTFGGVISERVNTVTARSKVNPIFG